MSAAGTAVRIEDAGEADLEVIVDIVSQAFGQPDEGRLVAALIRDEDAVISLVARRDEAILGHLMASPILLQPTQPLTCLGIAPLAVLPGSQNRGLGTMLMHAALDRARQLQVDALFLLGNPAYYQRFGFLESPVGNQYGATSAFQSLELTPECLSGIRARAHYAAAFATLDGTD